MDIDKIARLKGKKIADIKAYQNAGRPCLSQIIFTDGTSIILEGHNADCLVSEGGGVRVDAVIDPLKVESKAERSGRKKPLIRPPAPPSPPPPRIIKDGTKAEGILVFTLIVIALISMPLVKVLGDFNAKHDASTAITRDAA